jgi:quinohemoprotein ethanol dehydrogenase
MVPGDEWDYDSVQQLLLADLVIKGQPRKVLMQANKDGFYYVLDRITGKFISGQPWVTVTWAKGLNEETGRPIVNKEAYYGSDPVTIAPGTGGGHNWSPMSFNPATGLVYIPSTTTSSRTFAIDPKFEYKPGRPNSGIFPRGAGPNDTRPSPPAIGPEAPGGARGMLIAWDPVTQKERWRTPGGGGIGGGTVTTAGNLVFQVLNDGHLLAYSADQGEKLLDIQTNLRGGMGPPITYLVEGKQYVSLMGGTGAVTARDAQQAAQQAANGSASANTVKPKVLTFVLDGNAQLPLAQ